MFIHALILKLRHLCYDKGWKKSFPTQIKSICVGNVAVGGTGKTPMTELILRTLKENDVPAADAEMYGFAGSLFSKPPLEVAVVSRGYKRSSRGFKVVRTNSSASECGDEPLQIKRKFPEVTVVVDENRVEACDILAHPAKAKTEHFLRPDVIILDDAFQHRRIIPTKSILLTTFARPFYNDRLLPLGRLRDLKSRAGKADMTVVTKCPPYIEEPDKTLMAQKMGIKDYNCADCSFTGEDGSRKYLLFATTVYDDVQLVFPDGEIRYKHSKSAILFTGIADGTPLEQWLSKTYDVLENRSFADHHNYTRADIAWIADAARRFPTAIVVTTEKDAQRLRSREGIIPEDLRQRLFYAPIRTQMLTAAEQNCLKDFIF